MYCGVSTHDDLIGIMKVLSTATRRLDVKAQEGAIGLFAPLLPGRPVHLLWLLDSAGGGPCLCFWRRSRFGAVESVQQPSTTLRQPCRGRYSQIGGSKTWNRARLTAITSPSCLSCPGRAWPDPRGARPPSLSYSVWAYRRSCWDRCGPRRLIAAGSKQEESEPGLEGLSDLTASGRTWRNWKLDERVGELRREGDTWSKPESASRGLRSGPVKDGQEGNAAR